MDKAQLLRCFQLAVGVASGVFAFIQTHAVMKQSPKMAGIMELCTSGNGTAIAESDLHAYEPKLGGPFVCIITQFMLELNEEPAGILVWGLIATVAFPLTLLIFSEAGRQGARGLVRWPVLILLLSQVLGISVIFPALWIPAAVLGGGSGPPSPGRVRATQLLAIGYQLFGGVAFAGYLYLVWHATVTFESPSELLTALWGKTASPSVAFMTIDSSVLALALLLYLGIIASGNHVVLALLASPLIGPGAASAAVLYFRERQRIELMGSALIQPWVANYN